MAARSTEILKNGNDFISHNSHSSSNRSAILLNHRLPPSAFIPSFDQRSFDKRRPFFNVNHSAGSPSTSSSYRRPYPNSMHHFIGLSAPPHFPSSSSLAALNHPHSIPIPFPLPHRRRFFKSESADAITRESKKTYTKNAHSEEKIKSTETVEINSKEDQTCKEAPISLNTSQSSDFPSEEVISSKSSTVSSSNADKKRNKQLVRSEAVRDDCSPPPPSKSTQSVKNETELCETSSSKPDSKPESEESSKDSNGDNYTDFTGTDLQHFLVYTLQNNARERVHLLKIEQELITLVKDNERQSHKFPPMSSYHRMFVHRVAAFFGLDHNIDETGSSVIVIKQKGVTRIPEMRFRDQIKNMTHSLDEPKKLILKRDTASFEDTKSSSDRRHNHSNNYSDLRKCKSFEEREEQYVKVRARIFNQNDPENSLNANESQADGQDKEFNSIESTVPADLTTEQPDASSKQTSSSSSSSTTESNEPEEQNSKDSIVEKKSENSLENNAKSNSSISSESCKSASNQFNRFKKDEHSAVGNNQNHSHGRQSSSNEHLRTHNNSNNNQFKKASTSKSNHTVDNPHSIVPTVSLLPYPSDVNNQMRSYPFPVASYVDYSHPWFSVPAIPSQEVIPANAHAPIYSQPYLATNPDFYASGQTDKRVDKCKTQAYPMPPMTYFPYVSSDVQGNAKSTPIMPNSYDKESMTNCYNLSSQMASLCLNSNLNGPTSVNATNSTSYVMPDQIGSSAIPFYYLPSGYPASVAPNANMTPELIYSSMLSYHPHMNAHHHAMPATLSTGGPSTHQIIMIPGIGSSTNVASSFAGYKPILTNMAAAPIPPNVTNTNDSYVKINPYATFPSMQNTNPSHSTANSSRSTISTNKGYKPQQSPLLPTPQQQNQNVPTSYSVAKSSDGSIKSNSGNNAAFFQSFGRKEPFAGSSINSTSNSNNSNAGGSNQTNGSNSKSNNLGKTFVGKSKRVDANGNEMIRFNKRSTSTSVASVNNHINLHHSQANHKPISSNTYSNRNGKTTSSHKTSSSNASHSSSTSSTCAYRSLPVSNAVAVDTLTG